MSPAAYADAAGRGAPVVLADSGALPGAADQWASYLPPFNPTLSEELGVSNVPSVGAQDAASQAVLTATGPWAGIYNARFNERAALAQNFVAACGGAAQIFTGADGSGGTQIARAAPGPIMV
jgi:hypothetical protein